MQKDFHYYLTYVLSRKVGIDEKTAKLIAWANQFTDNLTKADLYGIQTQSAVMGNWNDRQIQATVLVPFHFIPGDEGWTTTRNCSRARSIVKTASNLFGLGIALHALQDTFSHENFSGWEEKSNACQWFWYIPRLTPNIGHADMGVIPDVVNLVWTDPRTGELIDNKERAMAAASSTYDFLLEYSGNVACKWHDIRQELEYIFKIKSYDQRKKELCKIVPVKRYKELTTTFQKKHKNDFIMAARQQLARMMELLSQM